VASVGDADRDGFDDFDVGAYESGATDNGYVRVWSGQTGGPYDVYLQFVFKDPAQPKGFALSNAVTMSFLP